MNVYVYWLKGNDGSAGILQALQPTSRSQLLGPQLLNHVALLVRMTPRPSVYLAYTHAVHTALSSCRRSMKRIVSWGFLSTYMTSLMECVSHAPSNH